MPYCRKCGAKLDDTARFCHVCGTPVTPSSSYAQQAMPAQTHRQVRRTGFPLAVIVVIIVAVLIFAALAVSFLPFQPVNFSQENEASAASVNTLKLNVNADLANVRISFRDLPGNQRAATNISATGWKGIFGADKPLALAFDESTNDSTLTYSIRINVAQGWLTPNSLNVMCDVYIDPSVNLDISAFTRTGAIVINANMSANFQNLALEARTGNVVVNASNYAVFSGPLWLQTTTGSVILGWDEADVSGRVPVNVRATTGSVDLDITRSRRLAGNVSLDVQAITGSIRLKLNIQDDVSASILAFNEAGGEVNIQQQGFSGDQSLESSKLSCWKRFQSDSEGIYGQCERKRHI